MGCGFRPLLAPGAGETGQAVLRQVAVDSIPERAGQVLRNELRARLHVPAPAAPRYALAVQISTSTSQIAVTDEEDDEEIGLNRLEVQARYRLRTLQARGDRPAGAELLADSLRVRTTFTRPERLLAAEEAEWTAQERALEQVSDRIVQRLAIFFERTEPAA